MKITDVKIRKTFNHPDDRLRALVSITLDGCFAVHDIKVIQGNDRLFAAMPSRRDESGKFRDIVHPTTPELRREFERIIIKAYQDYVSLFNTDSE